MSDDGYMEGKCGTSGTAWIHPTLAEGELVSDAPNFIVQSLANLK